MSAHGTGPTRRGNGRRSQRLRLVFEVASLITGVGGLLFGLMQSGEISRLSTEVREQNRKIADRDELLRTVRDHIPGLVTQLEDQVDRAVGATGLYMSIKAEGGNIADSRLVEEAQSLIDAAHFGRATQRELSAITDGIIDDLSEAIMSGDLDSVVFHVNRYAQSFDEKQGEIREAIRRMCISDEEILRDIEKTPS